MAKVMDGQGRQRLMDATLRLAYRSRSLHALGIREIGREAGLNPNTFYRHFRDLDALGLAIIAATVQSLRQPMRDLRIKAALAVTEAPPGNARAGGKSYPERAISATTRLFFDFVESHPEAFVIGIRELHGASPIMRQALREALAGFASDMAEDTRALNLLPTLDEDHLQHLSMTVIRNMFQLSMDYIEYPEQRETVRAQAELLIATLLNGAIVLSSAR